MTSDTYADDYTAKAGRVTLEDQKGAISRALV